MADWWESVLNTLRTALKVEVINPDDITGTYGGPSADDIAAAISVTNWLGYYFDPLSIVKHAPISSTDAETVVVAAVPAKKIRVLQYTLVCAAAVTCQWQSNITSEAETVLTGAMPFDANGGASPYCKEGLFETVAGEPLVLKKGADVDAFGHLTYIEV